jgi:dipeptide/tripeptide permease
MTRPSNTSILCNKVVLSILITETAERVAYFGFRAVLVLYFHNGLQLDEPTSISLFASVAGLAYFSPLIGAVLADSSWGRFHTIWIFSTVYSCGLCLLTFAAFHVTVSTGREQQQGDNNNNNNNSAQPQDPNDDLVGERILSFIGLFMICIGTGGIKPVVSAFGADQVVVLRSSSCPTNNKNIITTTSPGLQKKESDDLDNEQIIMFRDDEDTSSAEDVVVSNNNEQKENQDEVRQFFQLFYWCINVGALTSFAIIPIIRARYGFGSALLIPTAFMIFALLVFLSQRQHYQHRKRKGNEPTLSNILLVCFGIIKSRISDRRRRKIRTPNNQQQQRQERQHRHVPVPTRDDEQTQRGDDDSDGHFSDIDRDDVYHNAGQVVHVMPLMLFFPIFWMLYDQQGSVWTLQATRLKLHGLQPEQLQFLNPLLIMIFIPFFDQIAYPFMDRCGINIRPLRRMEHGMALASLSFFASALLEYFVQIQPPNSVSLLWQIPQITILTVAEILLNVTGLEFAYSQAPSNMQAVILSIFLFMTAIGDGFGALLFATIFSRLSTTSTMVVCALCMIVNLLFFSRVARTWEPYNKAGRYDDQEENGHEGIQLVGVAGSNGIL